MPSNTEITVGQLSRLIGLPDTPVLIDVRTRMIAFPVLKPTWVLIR
jgi:hypothetical protein